MGLNLSDLGPVYIVCGKTDLRKGIDSLAYLIQSQFDLDPFSKSVFLFCGGKSDRFKALYWDGEGFWLLYKRFENGQLTWPRSTAEVRALTPEQVEWLMKGFSITPKIFNELTLLREQVAYLTKKLYGKSSEKRDYNQNQLSLFDDMELPEEESDCPR